MSKYHEIVRGDLINANFHGNFKQEDLEQEQTLTGTGIVMDDQLNIFVGAWHELMMSGKGIIRLANGNILYGQFKNGQGKGSLGLRMNKYQLFIHRLQSKTNKQQLWRKQAVLIDLDLLLFYVLELTPRQPGVGQDLDRTQKIGSVGDSTAREGTVPWKVKIVERCGLNADGNLTGYSKYIKNKTSQKHKDMVPVGLEYSRRQFSIFEQNIISLVSTVLGDLQDPYLISPASYARSMSEEHPQLQAVQLPEGYWLVCRQRKLGCNALGLMITLQSRVSSFGNYNNLGQLNGLGVQYTKKGQAFTGTFKNNLLTRQYSQTAPSQQLTSTFQLRELLTHQHLKSVNYVNNCFYMEGLQSLMALGHKVVRYAGTFERQFEKRHLSYQESEGYNESSTEHNFMKYVLEDPKQKQSALQQHEQSYNSGRTKVVRPTKMAGFIVKSKSKSPKAFQEPSLSPSNSSRKVGTIRSHRKSPWDRNNNHY